MTFILRKRTFKGKIEFFLKKLGVLLRDTCNAISRAEGQKPYVLTPGDVDSVAIINSKNFSLTAF